MRRMLKAAADQTIHRVADEAGVSIVSVSRVFNDYPHVSTAMRHRVLQAARTIGYRPRFVSKPKSIAVVIGHLDILSAGDYKTRLVLHIVRVAARHGYLVEFIPYNAIDLATKRLVNGVIEVGLTQREIVQLEHLPPVPVVLVNQQPRRTAWSSVTSDHYDEGRAATAHLAQAGHRRIALVLDELEGWGVEQRAAGYRDVLAAQTPNDFSPLILPADTLSPLDIARAIIAQQCTACVNLTDNHGFALLDSLTNGLGLKIPADISVVCLENESVSQFLTPRLTTIAQPLSELAEIAVQCIVQGDQLDKHSFHRVLRCQLIARDSVRLLP